MFLCYENFYFFKGKFLFVLTVSGFNKVADFESEREKKREGDCVLCCVLCVRLCAHTCRGSEGS